MMKTRDIKENGCKTVYGEKRIILDKWCILAKYNVQI